MPRAGAGPCPRERTRRCERHAEAGPRPSHRPGRARLARPRPGLGLVPQRSWPNGLTAARLCRRPARSLRRVSGSLPPWSNGLRFRPNHGPRVAGAARVLEVGVTAVALVTGGTGGIGRAVCQRLAASGLAVVAGDVAGTAPPRLGDLTGPGTLGIPPDR